MATGLHVKLDNWRWRKLNPDNETTLGNRIPFDAVSVGKYSYGVLNVAKLTPDPVKLKIGCFCSIAAGVDFILGSDHDISRISAFPFKVRVLHSCPMEAISKGDIVVDDDVWIGQNATILSGVHIGQGAVVAAGAVVTSDVEPYTVVGGVPAKFIKKRFSDELITELVKVDYSKLTEEEIEKHIDELYDPLVTADQLAWMPRKKQ